ncbi:MAG TPA: phosphoenolpyruvate synthase [Candidatus Nanoarchaeia archaeon]|nr:phosphoenolpyruvate synthase [Candidatus Nanoarchaeia archaeon]
MKKVSDSESSKYIKWLSELSNKDVAIAGGKGASLAEMFNLKMNVPPAFIVTAQAFSYFIEHAGLKEKIGNILKSTNVNNTAELEENAKYIREMVESAEMPEEMQGEITEAYEALSFDKEALESATPSAAAILKYSREPVFVAVRSSATTEDLADASFAGQQETFLNVKGNKMLIEAVKKCFASLFTARAVYYRQKKGFEHDKSLLAIVVQKMINSEKSGVIFSKDPTGKSSDNIIIEAVFGLGEGIVSGMISPDYYALSPEFKILEKKVSDKKIALTRNSQGMTEQVSLTAERSMQQVLTDYEIRKLAIYSIELEQHYKKPQDIEFGIELGHIHILQSRPITTLGERKEAEEVDGKLILSGLAASPGVASGIVRVIKDISELGKIKKGDVLVTEMTNPDMVVTMQKCIAIVTDSGGMTAHASIVSREMGIPAVVGTKTATSVLKDGMLVTVDGFNGRIYEGKAVAKQAEIKPVVQTKTKIKVIVDLPDFAERASRTGCKDVGLTRIEGIIASSGRHPAYFLKRGNMGEYEEVVYNGISRIAKHFDEAWIRTSDIRSDEYRHLEGAPKDSEANPMLGMHGIRAGIKYAEILKAELRAMKGAAKAKKIGIMLSQVISAEEVRMVKEMLKEMKINIPGSNIKLGVMIETPAAVQIIEQLCGEGIDFISFGTNDLTQFTLAIDRGNEAVQYLYNEMHPAVLSQLAYVISICKKYNIKTSICGQAGSNKNMVEFLVKHGIDSISVNADAAYDISIFVKDLEDRGLRGSEAGSLAESNAQEQNAEVKEEKIAEEKRAEEKKEAENPVEQEKPAEDNFTGVELGFDPFEVQGAEKKESGQKSPDEAERREEDVKDVTDNELDIF